ncbi:MAG: BCCT family transporter [Rhodobacteraceae bacterium]|nr:BCCT family transporter [Paracoccaceae bacterium]
MACSGFGIATGSFRRLRHCSRRCGSLRLRTEERWSSRQCCRWETTTRQRFSESSGGLGDGFDAAIPLLAGGLGALQTASTAAAFPISFVLLAMAWGLFRSLAVDPGVVSISSDAIAPDGTRMSQELHV